MFILRLPQTLESREKNSVVTDCYVTVNCQHWMNKLKSIKISLWIMNSFK